MLSCIITPSTSIAFILVPALPAVLSTVKDVNDPPVSETVVQALLFNNIFEPPLKLTTLVPLPVPV